MVRFSQLLQDPYYVLNKPKFLVMPNLENLLEIILNFDIVGKELGEFLISVGNREYTTEVEEEFEKLWKSNA